MGQSGGAKDWNPNQVKDSTLGQFGQGNYGEAGRGASGALQNSMDFNRDLVGGLANPVMGISDVANSMGGQDAAAERRKQQFSDFGVAEQRQGEQQRQAQARQAFQGQQDQAKLASDTANKTYQDQQAGLTKSLDDENAFNAARNARRKATGQTLFGGWNG